MEQRTGSKLGKDYDKAVYYHPAYVTYMKSTLWAMLNWMKHKLESSLWEKYQLPQICRWYHPYGRKWRGTKDPLDESERAKWKSWLKAQHSENEDHGIQAHHFMTNRWGNNGNSERLCYFGLQNHCRWWLQPWNQKMLAPLKKSYDQPRQDIKKQRHYYANKCPWFFQ